MPNGQIPAFATQTSPPKPNWGNVLRSLITYALIALIGYYLYATFINPTPAGVPEISLTQAISDIKQEKVTSVTVEGDLLILFYKEGSSAISHKESSASFLEILQTVGVSDVSKNLDIVVKDSKIWAFWSNLLVNAMPFLIIGFIFFAASRQAQQTAFNIFNFSKSTARLFGKDGKKITFADAAGVDEAKQELKEVVDFLKNPEKYKKLGARIPKGVLLVGPAGTGKTLLARAVAGEANVPFYSMAGSEFMEMLVGVGSARVRDLFATAKKNAPSIIFIDEIESIGKHRGASVIASHGEQEQTLNQILVEMDGFTPHDQVIVVAATNRPDMLDPALTRPGRFDRRIVLELPDIEGRKQILNIHQKGKPLADNVNLERLAKRTVGFSGADIENMLNEAAILAARLGKKEVEGVDLEEAATKVKLGPERRRLQSEEDKKLTAYHEAGHAIVNASLPHSDPVHRVSIVSRGLALGFTQLTPETDRYNQTKTRLLEQITALLGGRAAEEMVFSEMTVGAGSDLETASSIARKMVIEYGMSKLGPLAFNTSSSYEEWPPKFAGEGIEVSPAMAAEIDSETKRIIDECYAQAVSILQKEKEKLNLVAGELIQKETLEQEEFEELCRA